MSREKIPQDISELVKKDKNLKDKFSKEFLASYFQLGYGALTKKDIDVFVYHLLSKDTNLLKDKSLYELSNLFKITESKLKSIQLEAHLRYNKIDRDESLKSVIDKIKASKIKPELEGDKVRVLIESPILKRDFESVIKSLGSLVDYSFNKDIVSIKLSSLIAALKKVSKKNGVQLEKDVIESIRKQFEDDKEVLELMNNKDYIQTLKKYGLKVSQNLVCSLSTLAINSLIGIQ